MDPRTPARLSVVGLAVAVGSVAVVLLPLVHRSTVASADPNQPPVIRESHLSLLAAEGWTVLVPMLIPVLISLVPVVCRHRRAAQLTRVVAAGLMAVGVMLAMASIGMLYLPLLGVLAAAAATGTHAAVNRPTQASNTGSR